MKPLLGFAAICLAYMPFSFCEEGNEITESRIAHIETALQEHSKLFENLTAYSQYDNGQSRTQMGQQNMSQQNMSGQDVMDHSAHGCLDSGFTIQAEFLYWRANMDMLEYVLQSNGDNILVSSKAEFHEPDFEYDPGVRVGIGYDFGRSNWDVLLAWTYHYTSVSDSRGSDARPLSQVATRFQTASGTTFNFIASTTAKADWQMRLNALDLEFGYDYFFSKQFSMRPHFGLKAAWLDMHYNVAYRGAIDSVAGNNISLGSMRTHSDYWAVGPRMGFDSYLHIGWGISLYGKVAGALIYGEYDAETKFTLDRDPTPPFNTTGVNNYPLKHNDYSRLRAVLEMSIGLEWGYCFSNEYYLGFNIGWENQYWWNQLETYFLTTDFHPRGDLTYSGLNAGVRFDF
ncbi:MAG: MOMP family protein [Chlamydiia bacterium]|nr:MOMP family protein [Chlamydiia bacterium]